MRMSFCLRGAVCVVLLMSVPAVLAEAPVWPDGARAALIFGFDDSGRPSHWMSAAPGLESFGFRGTFCLNTGAIHDWTPWRQLYAHLHTS